MVRNKGVCILRVNMVILYENICCEYSLEDLEQELASDTNNICRGYYKGL